MYLKRLLPAKRTQRKTSLNRKTKNDGAAATAVGMNFPHFFIDRPIFAGVISIVITLVGVIALSTLPIAQYPDIAPPTIPATTNYPGANAKVVSETVATPIEQQVNGFENMLYMSSQTTSDCNMTLRITFKLGTNLDTAQPSEQNGRVAAGMNREPAVCKGAATFRYSGSALGRLTEAKEFGEIAVKTGLNGLLTRLRNIARVVAAALDFTHNGGPRGKPPSAMP